MTFGFNYNLYNASHHTQKSAIYSYKANTYLNSCVHNIAQIAFNPRFIGLATCGLLLIAASFIPFFHIPVLSYVASHTLALISGDPAFIFTGVIFSSENYYSVFDKAKVFGATLMLVDNGIYGRKIAKCFVSNIQNICTYAAYKCLSWGEYFKSCLSDFLQIDKKSEGILDNIPVEKIVTSDFVQKISMHQKHVDFYRDTLKQEVKSSGKNITLEGGKLLGFTAVMSTILLGSGTPLVVITIPTKLLFYNLPSSAIVHNADCDLSVAKFQIKTHSVFTAYPFKIIGLLASIAPLFSDNDDIKKYYGSDVFSMKSVNYHLAKYATKEIYNEFIKELGSGVISLLQYSALIAYRSVALYKAHGDLKHVMQENAQKVLKQQEIVKKFFKESAEETVVNIIEAEQGVPEENSQEVEINTPEEEGGDQLLGNAGEIT